MAQKDQLFSNMHRAALDWLRDLSPEEISRRANVAFDGDGFRFRSLGQEIFVAYPGYGITPSLHHWHILTILHYLSSADGTPLSGKLISFSQYEHGLVRGGGFDADAERTIRDTLGVLPEEELLRRIRRLGGTRISDNADLCVKFPYLPNYPVYLKLWFADDEFPASGRMLLDSSAAHYLSIEDAVTIGDLILDMLCQGFDA